MTTYCSPASSASEIGSAVQRRERFADACATDSKGEGKDKRRGLIDVGRGTAHSLDRHDRSRSPDQIRLYLVTSCIAFARRSTLPVLTPAIEMRPAVFWCRVLVPGWCRGVGFKPLGWAPGLACQSGSLMNHRCIRHARRTLSCLHGPTHPNPHPTPTPPPTAHRCASCRSSAWRPAHPPSPPSCPSTQTCRSAATGRRGVVGVGWVGLGRG